MHARYEWNLPDEDGLLNDSDSYMEFITVDSMEIRGDWHQV